MEILSKKAASQGSLWKILPWTSISDSHGEPVADEAPQGIHKHYTAQYFSMQPPQPESLHDGLNATQMRTLNAMWEGLSKTARPRFDKYADASKDRDGFDPLSRYLWNIALGEALMPTICGVELMLRNAIHNSMIDETGDPLWFQVPGFLEKGQSDSVKKTYYEVDQKKRNKSTYSPPNADDLVGDLSFAFWTELLSSTYEKKIWSVLLKRRFSNFPGDLKDRETFKKEINKIKELRNRIVHHEPIFQLAHIVLLHRESRRILGAINAIYGKLIDIVDRFEDVHEAGSQHYRNLLLQKANHPPARAFHVETVTEGEFTKHTLMDVDLQMCAGVFDCEEMAVWIAKMANMHPSRVSQVAIWREWIQAQRLNTISP